MAEFLQSIGFDKALLNILKELLIVLGIGLLLGLEREHTKKRKEEGRLFAGIRTFPIVGITGYLSLFLASKFNVGIFIAAFLGVISLIALSYYRTQKTDTGTTTEFTLMITFILGGLVFAKFYHISVTVAVLITVLLTLKIEIHKVVSSLSEKDILSIIKFVIITALILPVLANRDFGPYGVFNFYKIWLIVAIFVSLNFAALAVHPKGRPLSPPEGKLSLLF
ncbi:MAG: MgtC/SapB family protein [Leptolyngbya sp. SIO1D8]|nr:MgtC/SapB family protein [Leptolyngbya sp. SIO1D8]